MRDVHIQNVASSIASLLHGENTNAEHHREHAAPHQQKNEGENAGSDSPAKLRVE
jgi:hypothetical protein